MMSGGLESHVEAGGLLEDMKPVDREKVCPLLLRVFCSNMRHNSMQEYYRGNVPGNELQIYTWMDCTLRELMGLIKEVNVEARRPGTEFRFALVRPSDPYEYGNNRRGNADGYDMRDIGVTISNSRGVDDHKTLLQCKFTIGDFIDVAVTPAQMGGPGRGGPPMMMGAMRGRRY